MFKRLPLVLLCSLAIGNATASVDSDFKPIAHERFSIYTGDGNYKQAYRWSFNEDGAGPPVTVFLNHGSGGEWYDEIETEFGLCGPDYIGESGDFDGSEYQGLCELDEDGKRLYLADFEINFVPVGPKLEYFMLKKIVGSTKFAAWYWQDGFKDTDSPVNVFLVGRYNVVKDPSHLNNALYWLNVTDEDSVTKDTQPPYNFDGYGVSDIDNDDRPFHTTPDISAFDNMFLYKAVKEQYPDVSLEHVMIEGRSNGGSAMVALASDYAIWPEHMRAFWSRNLSTEPTEPVEEPVREYLSLEAVANDPVLREAFSEMLGKLTYEDVTAQLEAGHTLELSANGVVLKEIPSGVGGPGYKPGETIAFNPETFRFQLPEVLGGDFYDDVLLVHSLYPGCRLDGIMEKDDSLADGVVAPDGDNNVGYQVAIKTLFSFAAQDKIYTSWCDDRVNQGAFGSRIDTFPGGDTTVIGTAYNPARHGFDYKDVHRNLDKHSPEEREKAYRARQAVEYAISTARSVLREKVEVQPSPPSYSLPLDLD